MANVSISQATLYFFKLSDQFARLTTMATPVSGESAIQTSFRQQNYYISTLCTTGALFAPPVASIKIPAHQPIKLPIRTGPIKDPITAGRPAGPPMGVAIPLTVSDPTGNGNSLDGDPPSNPGVPTGGDGDIGEATAPTFIDALIDYVETQQQLLPVASLYLTCWNAAAISGDSARTSRAFTVWQQFAGASEPASDVASVLVYDASSQQMYRLASNSLSSLPNIPGVASAWLAGQPFSGLLSPLAQAVYSQPFSAQFAQQSGSPAPFTPNPGAITTSPGGFKPEDKTTNDWWKYVLSLAGEGIACTGAGLAVGATVGTDGALIPAAYLAVGSCIVATANATLAGQDVNNDYNQGAAQVENVTLPTPLIVPPGTPVETPSGNIAITPVPPPDSNSSSGTSGEDGSNSGGGGGGGTSGSSGIDSGTANGDSGNNDGSGGTNSGQSTPGGPVGVGGIGSGSNPDGDGDSGDSTDGDGDAGGNDGTGGDGGDGGEGADGDGDGTENGQSHPGSATAPDGSGDERGGALEGGRKLP